MSQEDFASVPSCARMSATTPAAVTAAVHWHWHCRHAAVSAVPSTAGLQCRAVALVGRQRQPASRAGKENCSSPTGNLTDQLMPCSSATATASGICMICSILLHLILPV